MATVSKDSKKINTLKEEFERRDLNVHSIRRVIKNSLEGISSYAKDGKSFIIYVFCSLIEIIAGFAFNVNGLEWILIISMLGIILAIELLNTAIEQSGRLSFVYFLMFQIRLFLIILNILFLSFYLLLF